jgi:UDP-N-acetylglucosamine 2-epimerase
VLEPLFEFERPDAVIVVGDVNASLAAAVSAAKAGLPVVHLDSGLRSGDMSIAEEINRVLISRVAALHLTPSETALTNLEDEAIEPERIVFVGNVTAESVIKHMSEIRSLDPSQRWGLAPRSFVLAAFHQRENIGVRRILTAICEALTRSPLPVVWVVNEQVRTALEEACISLPMHVNFTEAIGYREMLAMQCDAAAVLTDSSGVQQEACMLHTPCVTVLHATEQTETIEAERREADDPHPFSLQREHPLPFLHAHPRHPGDRAILLEHRSPRSWRRHRGLAPALLLFGLLLETVLKKSKLEKEKYMKIKVN